ncbi:MAG: VOC family protein, partial [Acidobacteriota bacterium]
MMTESATLGYNGGLTCALQCSDLDASLAWYQEVLGFELLYKEGDLAWAELRTPVENVQLGLGQ